MALEDYSRVRLFVFVKARGVKICTRSWPNEKLLKGKFWIPPPRFVPATLGENVEIY